MDIDASKKILLLCTSENFKEIIEMLKTKTVNILYIYDKTIGV